MHPIQLRRLPDWQKRLEEFVRSRQRIPFAWGENDCCVFAADAALAMTGTDPAAGLRGLGPLDAVRFLRARGGVVGLMTGLLGKPLSPRMARIGDVVAVPAGKRVALAICNGQTSIGPSSSGIVAIPTSQAVHCWRVG